MKNDEGVVRWRKEGSEGMAHAKNTPRVASLLRFQRICCRYGMDTVMSQKQLGQGIRVLHTFKIYSCILYYLVTQFSEARNQTFILSHQIPHSL